MYYFNNEHCQDCLCSSCMFRRTDNCIDGKSSCDQCKNDTHVVFCIYYERED